MAMSSNCGGCGERTSYICAAQYTHGGETIILCKDCYDEGHRCWFLDGKLVVSKEQPPGSQPAYLYWDEGGWVTGGHEPVLYPNTEQPPPGWVPDGFGGLIPPPYDGPTDDDGLPLGTENPV